MSEHYVLFWKQTDYQAFPGKHIQQRETWFVWPQVTEMEECALKNHLYPLREEAFNCSSQASTQKRGARLSRLRLKAVFYFHNEPTNLHETHLSHWLIYVQYLQDVCFFSQQGQESSKTEHGPSFRVFLAYTSQRQYGPLSIFWFKKS